MKILVLLSLLTLTFSSGAFAQDIQYYHAHGSRHHGCYQNYNASDRYDDCYDRPQQHRHCDDRNHCPW